LRISAHACTGTGRHDEQVKMLKSRLATQFTTSNNYGAHVLRISARHSIYYITSLRSLLFENFFDTQFMISNGRYLHTHSQKEFLCIHVQTLKSKLCVFTISQSQAIYVQFSK